jgi:hypothetical protein
MKLVTLCQFRVISRICISRTPSSSLKRVVSSKQSLAADGRKSVSTLEIAVKAVEAPPACAVVKLHQPRPKLLDTIQLKEEVLAP